MSIFTTGIIVLVAMTALFYVVFFSFIYYWHLKKTTYIVVPVIFTFQFFVTGFFVVAITSLVLEYLPALIKVLSL